MQTVPRWDLKESSLGNYLRECVWSLERVDTQFTMIRHSWSTPCFSPDEDSDSLLLLPCPEDDDEDDDINGPLFMGMLRSRTSSQNESDDSYSKGQSSASSNTPKSYGGNSPTRSVSSPVRCPSSSRSCVAYKSRKTSMPLPLGIPEDREASCDSAYLSPFGSPPTICISSSPRFKVSIFYR